MTRKERQEQSDRDYPHLLEMYFAAHRRCGTDPHPDSLRRYEDLKRRVPEREVAA